MAAISFAVFALSALSVQVDLNRPVQLLAVAMIVLAAGAIAALFASAYQVVMSEWLFVYHEPPRLPDLVDSAASSDAEAENNRLFGLLAASYAVAYEQ